MFGLKRTPNITGNHDAKRMPFIMNRTEPTDSVEPLPHITEPATREEMINAIEDLMRKARPRIGLEQYTDPEVMLQNALWDEWVCDIPGFAVTLSRVRANEIDIETATEDINRAIDAFNILT